MNKKAQGLSMNVIIIAAISLLVLIVLIVLVIRASGNMTKGTGCEGAGGRCESDDGTGTSCTNLETEAGVTWSHNMAYDGKAGGCSEGYICCIRTANNPITP